MAQRIETVSYDGLYTAHYGEVLRLCRLLLGNQQDAEEIAQEVFLKVHQELQHLNRPELMMWKAWLTRVSVNACRDRRRSGWWKLWHGSNQEYQDADYPGTSGTPEEALLSREIHGRIWGAFDKLSARQREVFVLRHVDEWSTEEVADMLGITTGSVKRYLFRAVRQLRRVLGETQ